MDNVRQNRLRKVFDYLVFRGAFKTQGEFAEIIAANKTNLSSAMNGNEKYLSDSLFQKICTAFPALNEEWLKTGEGEMLKVPATLTVFAPTDEERREIGESVDIKAYPAEVVEEIKAEVAEEIKEEMAIPIISPEIANDPKTNIKKYIDDKADELEHINPSDLTHQADGAERIRKTSMLPTFAPGDIVFVKFIKDKHNIIDGQTYYFDMRTRPTMIRRVKIEGDKLRLIAKNPAFGDMLVSFDDILNIADIVGLFRSSFGDQYDEIETVRRKKDEQIDNLLTQNGGLIEQNGEALKIIRDLMKNKA
jgi:phage repressor protein C with HTH and peptisase S24 domain